MDSVTTLFYFHLNKSTFFTSHNLNRVSQKRRHLEEEREIARIKCSENSSFFSLALDMEIVIFVGNQ